MGVWVDDPRHSAGPGGGAVAGIDTTPPSSLWARWEARSGAGSHGLARAVGVGARGAARMP